MSKYLKQCNLLGNSSTSGYLFVQNDKAKIEHNQFYATYICYIDVKYYYKFCSSGTNVLICW